MSSDLVQKLRDGNTLDIGEAADRIEALEGEVRRVNDLLVDAHQHANKWMKERDKESARAERLRVALGEIAELEPDSTAWSVEHARKALEDDKQ